MTEHAGDQVDRDIELERQGLDFWGRHIDVSARIEYEEYSAREARAWKERVIDDDMSPMWLRRTFDMGSEFGVAIDYGYPTIDGGFRCLALLVIDGEGGPMMMTGYVPKQDGTGEPIACERGEQIVTNVSLGEYVASIEEYVRQRGAEPISTEPN